MSRSARPAIPAISAALLALALFAVSIGGTYIYDDVAVIQTDQRLTDPAQWSRYWKESYNQGVDNLYRPLVSMTYAFQWYLHGDQPWVFHLINVLLHASVSACVAEFSRRLMGFHTGLLAGVLFAAHPIHVEGVANIVGRAELMCALGTVGALVLMLRPLTHWRSLAITACFILAVLSKEQGMLLPLLILILALLRRWIEPRDHIPAPLSAGAKTLIISLCWLLAGYIVWRESILKFWWDRNFIDWTINPMIPTDTHPHGGSVGADRWLMPLALLGRYTGLLVFPLKLSPDYGAKVIGWHVALSDPHLWLGIAALLAWASVLAFCIVRRSIPGIFAALATGITYSLIGNIFTLIGTNFAERLMYLPSAFFLMLVAMLLARLQRTLLIPLAGVLLVLACLRSFTYAKRWNDKLGFYATSLAEQPKSIRLYMLTAAEHHARGQLADAERVIKAGRDMLPEYWEIWLQTGVILMDQGKFDEAQECFDRAGLIRPSPKVQGFSQLLAERRAAATRPATQR